MAKNTYDGDITLQTDWGGDKSTGNLPVSGDAVQRFLRNRLTSPFIGYDDPVDKCKRLFRTEEDRDLWLKLREDKLLTPELDAFLQFSGTTFPTFETQQLNVNVINDGESAIYGSGNHVLRFNFSTYDRISDSLTEEAVEIFFRFESSAGTKSDTRVFQYKSENTEYDISNYLEAGENVITLMVTGKSSGLRRSVRCTYTLVNLQIDSNFDYHIAKQYGKSFGIPYEVSGQGVKDIEFLLDNDIYINDDIPEASASRIYQCQKPLAPGIHTLQMKARTQYGGKRFESDMLYFSFIVMGEGLDITAVLVKARFKSGTEYFYNRQPGLIGEQFVDNILHWAYFSTSRPNATVMWKTQFNGVETLVGSQEVDEKEGTVNVLPDPVVFRPDRVGKYDLYAYIKGDEENHIGQFTVNVVENSAGLREAPDYTMKLDAKGRSNNEPIEVRTDWSNNGYKSHFNERMGFDGLAGYTGQALRLAGGATVYNECKPFASENSILQYGMTLSFDFMTRNVQDENVALIRVGNEDAVGTAFFAVYGKKMILRPSNGKALTYEFASEERVHLAIVIMPKEGVTDKQMMFLVFNGIQGPGIPYDNTAVFNIGSYADRDDTNGMIFLGDETGRADIDIYGIRVYPKAISTWEGMNNFMIDAGENVGEMMKRNALFSENNLNKIILDRVREKFRTLECITPLRSLDDHNEKYTIWGSVRYTDPFNPKFNFERMDGRVKVETAGQSRLADLMAKSFHLSLNEDENQATYQDGKLTYKNRIIFAERNVPDNDFRVDVCGADSSIARNAAHFKLVNKFYPQIEINGEHPLRTPAQEYVLSGQYSRDMAKAHGGNAADYQFPYNINLAPDSVPVVILFHENENDPVQFYALGVLMEEKKASFCNGNQSIRDKICADGTLDPYDRFAGDKGNRLWDNDGTIEMEFLRGSDFTYSISVDGWNAETREASFEISFPKSKDLKADLELKEWTWKTFHDEFAAPLVDLCKSQVAFDDGIENVIDLYSFAMYYNKVMDKKLNDSLCRNMKVLRIFRNGKWVWFAKWWDTDVSTGLFPSGAMGCPIDADRNTRDANGKYIMSGRDDDGKSMRIWDCLENSQKFKDMCLVMAKESYAKGWTVDAEIKAQDEITDSFSEALYNVDGIMKFLRAFRLGNDYLIRYQGSSKPYRHGFLKGSYGIREAQQAIGDYYNDAVYFRAQGAKSPRGAIVKAASKYWFGFGLDTTNYATGVVKDNEDDAFRFDIPENVSVAREPIRFYGASKMQSIDISEFLTYFSDAINLGYLRMAQEVYIGYPDHEKMAEYGISLATSISFTGLSNLAVCKVLSIAGLHGLETFDLKGLNQLKRFLAAGSGLKVFAPDSGTKFTEVELPDTLQVIEATKCTFGNLSFWSLDGNEAVRMTACPTALLAISLTGMGDDEGSHALVHSWLTMLRNNPHLIQTAQITYRAINWHDMDKQDLLTLARIPKAQRNLTGYVFCDAIYTDTERQLLSQAFGSNVFDPDAQSLTLVCDGKGDGISITGIGETAVMSEGSISIEQGNTLYLTGAGFPISNSNAKNYRWRVWLNGEWQKGTDTKPVLEFNGYTLNALTGELTSVERAIKDPVTLRLSCQDINTYAFGEVEVSIMPRSYPTDAVMSMKDHQQVVDVIEGVLTVSNQGQLSFGIDHLPNGFTGTMVEDGGKWTLIGKDEEYMSEVATATAYDLKITALPKDDVNLTLRYQSSWKNGTVLTANEIRMAIMTVIERLLINDATEGNDVLFRIVEGYGIAHKAEAYYTSMELKQLTGEFDAHGRKDLRKMSSGEYFVPRYMKNVTAYNLSDTALTDTFDATATPQVQGVNLEGTYADCKF